MGAPAPANNAGFIRALAGTRKVLSVLLLLCLGTIVSVSLLESITKESSYPSPSWEPSVLFSLAAMATFVFILPFACLRLKGKWQTRIHLLASIPAWIATLSYLVLGEPLAPAQTVAGFVTLFCWLGLFLASCYAIARKWWQKWANR